MLKVIDVDFIEDQILELVFNDGFIGRGDLSELNLPKTPEEFKRFSLTKEGSLRWKDKEISAKELREITQGNFSEIQTTFNLNNLEQVIKQAAWESMTEGRPDILQAVIRSYVEHYGHSKVIEKADIKSRTSAYRTLKPETKPSFASLVQLGNAVIELAKTEPLAT